jgi:hypothetical protein
MVTFSITTPNQARKEEVQERFKKWKDIQPGNPSMFEAFVALLNLAEEGIENFHVRTEPLSVQQTIEQIACPFLKFEDYDFKCFERFDSKRKPDLLGTDPGKVFTRCESCKEGKAQKILEQYQKKMRGQNIRGILSMIKTFETFATSGIPTTIYFCNRIKGRQVITGKKRMHCSKVNFELVPIDPACKNPKCKFFQEFTVKVDQEFPRETLKLIEGIAEDYKRIEDLSPTTRKEVESDVS